MKWRKPACDSSYTRKENRYGRSRESVASRTARHQGQGRTEDQTRVPCRKQEVATQKGDWLRGGEGAAVGLFDKMFRRLKAASATDLAEKGFAHLNAGQY